MYWQPSFEDGGTVCMEGTQETWHRHKKQTCFMLYPTRRKFSLEFRFRYLANGKFIKFQFCTLLDFHSFFNECLYTLQEEKFLLEFEFCYFANGEFAKSKFCLLLHFQKSLNDSLYD